MVLRVTTEKYRAWLQLLIDGNQNMIRVWGGGVYEADVFYGICDGEVLKCANSLTRLMSLNIDRTRW